jgi:hypothetical protein
MTDTADKEPTLPPLPAPYSFIGFSDVKRATEDVYSAAQMREYAIAALSAVQAVPGWVMVPEEPTQEMMRAGDRYAMDTAHQAKGLWWWGRLYQAMLEAAPKMPPTKEPK